ncbi:hypothetical protein H9P43_010156 [Blastocladiella emersonii ATCC 22665]|nr:hypothetical protein H9P43_010156 [Blastocladiella emersonii ATCC 22665]
MNHEYDANGDSLMELDTRPNPANWDEWMPEDLDDGQPLNLEDRAGILRAQCLSLLDQLGGWSAAGTLDNGGSSWSLLHGGACYVWPGPRGLPTPIDGLHKLEAALRAELGFLDDLLANPARITASNVASSNLAHLEAVVATLMIEPHPVAVFKTFTYSAPCSECYGAEQRQLCVCSPVDRATRELERRVRIDVVADHGRQWIKLRASGPRAIMSEFLTPQQQSSHSSNGSAGGTQLLEYAKCARANPVLGLVPQLHFRFTRVAGGQLDPRVHSQLYDAGFHVTTATPSAFANHCGPVDLARPVHCNHSSLASLVPTLTSTINLDCSTLIALTSELPHTRALPPAVAAHPSFAAQLATELASPLLGPLVAALQPCSLVVTQRALDRFRDILRTVAGPRERIRGMFLLPRLVAPGDVADGHDDVRMFVDPVAEQAATEAGLAARQESGAVPLLHPDLREILGPLVHLPLMAGVPNHASARFTELRRITEGADARAAAIGLSSLSARERRRHEQAGTRAGAIVYVNGRRPRRLERARLDVFGTGDALGAVTVTANVSFVRSVQELTIPVPAWTHQPRSLTELKALMETRCNVLPQQLEAERRAKGHPRDRD